VHYAAPKISQWNLNCPSTQTNCVGKGTIVLPTPWRRIMSSRVIDPFILNVNTSWRWTVTSRPCSLTPVKDLRCPFYSRLFGPKDRLGFLEKRAISCSYRCVRLYYYYLLLGQISQITSCLQAIWQEMHARFSCLVLATMPPL